MAFHFMSTLASVLVVVSCIALEDKSCDASLLQVGIHMNTNGKAQNHGAATTSATRVEDEAIEWVAANQNGDDCDTACDAYGTSCSEAHLQKVTDKDAATLAFQSANVSCTSVDKTDWNVDFIHMAKCNHPMCCGGKCVGACSYQTDVKATCSAKVPELGDGYHLKRLCPCKKKPTWVLDEQKGYSCDSTCIASGVCSEPHLKHITGKDQAKAAFDSAAVSCTSVDKTDWNVDFIHMAKCSHPMCCGGKCVGACSYQTDVKATCSAKAPTLGDGVHLQRLCPCMQVQWVLSLQNGDSCDSTCAALGQSCSGDHLKKVFDKDEAQAAFDSAGVSCTSVDKTDWNVDFIHMAKCSHPMCCGGKCVGACSYQTDVKATCSAKAPTLGDGVHLQRLCPCI